MPPAPPLDFSVLCTPFLILAKIWPYRFYFASYGPDVLPEGIRRPSTSAMTPKTKAPLKRSVNLEKANKSAATTGIDSQD